MKAFISSICIKNNNSKTFEEELEEKKGIIATQNTILFNIKNQTKNMAQSNNRNIYNNNSNLMSSNGTKKKNVIRKFTNKEFLILSKAKKNLNDVSNNDNATINTLNTSNNIPYLSMAKNIINYKKSKKKISKSININDTIKKKAAFNLTNNIIFNDKLKMKVPSNYTYNGNSNNISKNEGNANKEKAKDNNNNMYKKDIQDDIKHKDNTEIDIENTCNYDELLNNSSKAKQNNLSDKSTKNIKNKKSYSNDYKKNHSSKNTSKLNSKTKNLKEDRSIEKSTLNLINNPTHNYTSIDNIHNNNNISSSHKDTILIDKLDADKGYKETYKHVIYSPLKKTSTTDLKVISKKFKNTIKTLKIYENKDSKELNKNINEINANYNNNSDNKLLLINELQRKTSFKSNSKDSIDSWFNNKDEEINKACFNINSDNKNSLKIKDMYRKSNYSNGSSFVCKRRKKTNKTSNVSCLDYINNSSKNNSNRKNITNSAKSNNDISKISEGNLDSQYNINLDKIKKSLLTSYNKDFQDKLNSKNTIHTFNSKTSNNSNNDNIIEISNVNSNNIYNKINKNYFKMVKNKSKSIFNILNLNNKLTNFYENEKDNMKMLYDITKKQRIFKRTSQRLVIDNLQENIENLCFSGLNQFKNDDKNDSYNKIIKNNSLSKRLFSSNSNENLISETKYKKNGRKFNSISPGGERSNIFEDKINLNNNLSNIYDNHTEDIPYSNKFNDDKVKNKDINEKLILNTLTTPADNTTNEYNNLIMSSANINNYSDLRKSTLISFKKKNNFYNNTINSNNFNSSLKKRSTKFSINTLQTKVKKTVNSVQKEIDHEEEGNIKNNNKALTSLNTSKINKTTRNSIASKNNIDVKANNFNNIRLKYKNKFRVLNHQDKEIIQDFNNEFLKTFDLQRHVSNLLEKDKNSFFEVKKRQFHTDVSKSVKKIGVNKTNYSNNTKNNNIKYNICNYNNTLNEDDENYLSKQDLEDFLFKKEIRKLLIKHNKISHKLHAFLLKLKYEDYELKKREIKNHIDNSNKDDDIVYEKMFKSESDNSSKQISNEIGIDSNKNFILNKFKGVIKKSKYLYGNKKNYKNKIGKVRKIAINNVNYTHNDKKIKRNVFNTIESDDDFSKKSNCRNKEKDVDIISVLNILSKNSNIIKQKKDDLIMGKINTKKQRHNTINFSSYLSLPNQISNIINSKYKALQLKEEDLNNYTDYTNTITKIYTKTNTHHSNNSLPIVSPKNNLNNANVEFKLNANSNKKDLISNLLVENSNKNKTSDYNWNKTNNYINIENCKESASYIRNNDIYNNSNLDSIRKDTQTTLEIHSNKNTNSVKMKKLNLNTINSATKPKKLAKIITSNHIIDPNDNFRILKRQDTKTSNSELNEKDILQLTKLFSFKKNSINMHTIADNTYYNKDFNKRTINNNINTEDNRKNNKQLEYFNTNKLGKYFKSQYINKNSSIFSPSNKKVSFGENKNDFKSLNCNNLKENNTYKPRLFSFENVFESINNKYQHLNNKSIDFVSNNISTPINTNISMKEQKRRILDKNFDYEATGINDFVSINNIRELIKKFTTKNYSTYMNSSEKSKNDNICNNSNVTVDRYTKEFKKEQVIKTTKDAVNDMIFINSLDSEASFRIRDILYKRYGVTLDTNEIFNYKETQETRKTRKAFERKNDIIERFCSSVDTLENQFILLKKNMNKNMIKYNEIKYHIEENR